MAHSTVCHMVGDKLELELRRGVVVLAVLSQLGEFRYGYELRQSLSGNGLPIEEGTLYPQRKDVALELRALLRDELDGSDDPLARLRAFGRPTEVAARYGRPLTVIDQADTRRFVRLSVIGVLVIWLLGAASVRDVVHWYWAYGIQAFGGPASSRWRSASQAGRGAGGPSAVCGGPARRLRAWSAGQAGSLPLRSLPSARSFWSMRPGCWKSSEPHRKPCRPSPSTVSSPGFEAHSSSP